MSNTHLDRAKILTEALPYIQRYNGKIVVVNCGGVAMDAELRDAVATDITMLRLVGIKVVLVHGIGPEVKRPWPSPAGNWSRRKAFTKSGWRPWRSFRRSCAAR